MNESYGKPRDNGTHDLRKAESEAIIRLALAKVRQSGIVQPLLSLVEFGDHIVRRLAVVETMDILPSLEQDQVASAAKSSDYQIREKAFAILVRLGTPTSISELSKGLSHIDPEIRKSCAGLLAGQDLRKQ